jgi:DNA-binding response OmpR family regulator
MLTNIKFLVVDDQPPIRAMVTAILKSAGAQWIDFAGDGESALEAIRWRRPDIVITDMLMAGMDGLDLVRTVRRAGDRDSAFVPVIMLTARTEISFVEQARDAGVTEFAAKPISAANLLQRINAVIMRPRPFVRSKVYVGPCRRRRADGATPRRRAADRKAK